MKNLIQKALVDAGFELGANDPDFMTAYFQHIMLKELLLCKLT